MCGRFTLTTADYDAVAEALEAEIDPALAALYRPRFNVAPTDVHPMLVAGDAKPRRLALAKWGMVPPPRPGAARPGLQINVRSEGIARGYIKGAFARHRCAIVADGFYEWTGPKTARRPIRFHLPDGGLFVFAAVFLPQSDAKTGERRPHFAILTTEANERVRGVHDRMPVILGPDDIDAWLQPGDAPEQLAHLQSLLVPTLRTVPTVPTVPTVMDSLVATPASPRVNDVKNDDEACLVPPDASSRTDENPELPGL
jgi:putative SOS response-associated peptidase YedK